MIPIESKRHWLARFLVPELTWKFLLRLALVAALAYLVFGHVWRPMRITGASMEPTYADGSLAFCFLWRYRFRPPTPGEVVAVEFTGHSVMYLKRVVATAGQTVEFRGGQLLVDGQPADEPYVVLPCDWELPPRQVKPGHVYVVGDNRSVPIERHDFGQVAVQRIAGGPLW